MHSVPTGQVQRQLWRNELKWNISNWTGWQNGWVFIWKELPIQIVKGVSLWDPIWLCSTWQKKLLKWVFVVFHSQYMLETCLSILHLKFSIIWSRPFVLPLKLSGKHNDCLIYTISKAIFQNVKPHFGSQDKPSWVTALLIARQTKSNRNLPSCSRLIFLWIDYLCMLVHMTGAVIGPYSCGNN